VNLLAIARADFLERVRRPGYLVTLAFMVYAAHLFLPPNHARYATFRIADYRGLYNSHWVGTVSALLASVFVSFAGFYLVKNAVERDRRSGVGAIIAATRVPTSAYLFGKFLSNLAVLSSMLGVMAVAVAILQWVRAEDRLIEPIAILAPLVLVSLPMMALTAGAAVAFEATPGLRGGFGNVVFFFLWIATLSLGAGDQRSLFVDPAGGATVIASATGRCRELGLPIEGGGLSVGFNVKETGVWDLTTFDYRGIRWTPGLLGARLLWLLAGCALPLAASIWFDRFDTVAAPAASSRKRRRRSSAAPDLATTPGPAASPGLAAGPGDGIARAVSSVADLAPATRGGGLLPLLRAELAIQLRGRSRWWWLVAIGLAVATALVPVGPARGIVHGLAWIWPLFLWSSMGAREQIHGTSDILFSAPRPLARQLTALWVVGVAIAGLAALGVPVRALLERNPAAALAWLGGACFVPSLALACGVWSGSGKLFEVLYLMLWYAGPINQAPPLDYGGFTAAGLAAGVPFRFALCALPLLALAVAGRRRQILAGPRG
jgi:hypothetical protein